MAPRTLRVAWPAVPVLLAVIVTTLLVVAVGGDPVQVFSALATGSFGSPDRILNTLAFWVPLLLCSTGLLITFTGGLWNIGIEGQLIMGAIGASWVAIAIAAPNPWLPSWVIIPLEILAAIISGSLWAALAAVFKTRGGIHEIFGG